MSPNDQQNLRRDNEPSAGQSSVPMWLILLLGLFFYWGVVYLDNNAGGFNPKVYHGWENYTVLDEAQPKTGDQQVLADGKKVFDSTCSLCHQPNGLGAEGKAPPLVGSEWVLAPKPDRIIRIVLDGLQGPVTVKGTEWNLAMASWKGTFSDHQIAAALSYIRNTWGNKAPMVKEDQVKAIRDKEKSRTQPWTAPELQAIPDR
jgi:mono/diheme cytochrome c family protein